MKQILAYTALAFVLACSVPENNIKKCKELSDKIENKLFNINAISRDIDSRRVSPTCYLTGGIGIKFADCIFPHQKVNSLLYDLNLLRTQYNNNCLFH